ncbi:protein-glutamate methylesterase/protein-glutamine glutaminase [Kosmotoga pacifica]|uniref:Protein-glutamate methylesterase/protein-glutamine glutaminase n=1 Tax=Kosmotoga pacifica TaxID=1330330 RepID=A0A0G2ZCI4_9BACT|nr:chemotaxis response regulator protein-glutamate methylesterase [Kosmotoga pacifica]AKI97259.1 chemotaxis protein CheY [Kosmotoga pacifica]
MKEIRVLIVDDSPLTRRLLKTLLESDPEIKVVGFGRNGFEAVEMAKELLPDVIILDVIMPEKDGFEALKELVEDAIAPVIIVSVITQEYSQEALEALEIGAFDYIPKPENNTITSLANIRDLLVSKVKLAYKQSKNTPLLKRLKRNCVQEEIISKPKADSSKTPSDFYAIAIGISTGGPKNIYDVLPVLPSDLNAAVFLIQHMPSSFTTSYAERLNRYCQLRVVEANEGMSVEPGTVYVGKGGYHLKLKKLGDSKCGIHLTKTPKHIFMPSVDIMMQSVLKVFGNRTVGILMTGMGDDGAKAMVQIKNSGGYTIAESEETAVVFGMPQEAIKLGGVDIILPSYKIPEHIVKRVGRKNQK